jgi:mitochondrial import inner membrane translocase subunit TIM9
MAQQPGVAGLPVPEHQQPELIRHLEETQVKNSLKMLNNLTQVCFDKCVTTGWGGSMGSKTLDSSESKCISECSEKYMKVTQRIGARYAEFAAQQQ